jgi:glycyl-tRNA synthetase
MMPADATLMEKLTALCKRRGFIYPGSEIYGGIGGFWDYGPLGVELKRNIKDIWWHDMVTNPPDGPDGKEITMVGVDAALIMNPKVWEASGHVGGFSDPMVDCKQCKSRFRLDQIHYVEVLPPEGGDPIASFCVEADSSDDALLQCFPKAQKAAKKWGGEHGGRCYALAKVIDTKREQLKCPRCEAVGSFTDPREFNLMFETYVGALQDASSKAYLRPETAQGIFANWSNVLDTQRVKLPFGIAQIGKAFRNEINPRNYTFRSREFEQMEIEFFCRGGVGVPPAKGESTDMEWYEFWRKVRYDWYVNLGLKSEKLRLREQTEDELAHYSKCCADIEYLFPFSDEHQELEGVAHRGCYDLEQHQKHSGKDLAYFDDDLWQQDAHRYKDDKQAAKKAKEGPPYRFLPTVIEPSAGVDRSALAFLCEAYTEDEAPDEKGVMQQRVVMKLHPKLAPIKVAVFPLVNREAMPQIAEQIYRDAKKHMTAFFDMKGAIGRRYRRQDEAGTPFCVTVDGQTLEDGTVTIRDRDTLAQIRVHKDQVVSWVRERLGR